MEIPSALVVGVVAAILGLGYFGAWRSQRRRQQIRDSGLLPPPGQETDDDVDRLLQHGQKIEAIKVYRALHGGGLKEAKEAVERRQEKQGRR